MTTASRAQLDKELTQGKRRRRRQESILALVFVAPATIITFVFGIWPVIFGFFVSLHQWRARSHSFLGLDQYVRALGNVAYVLAFLLCILFFYGSYIALRKIETELDDARAHGVTVPIVPFAAAALILAAGSVAFAAGFAAQTTDVLLIGLALLVAGGLVYRWASGQTGGHATGKLGLHLWQGWLFLLLGVGLFLFTIAEITGDSSMPFQIVRKLAPDVYLPTLEDQMTGAAVLGLALAGIWGLRRWLRRIADDYARDTLRGVLRLGVVALWIVVGAMVVYLISAFQFDQTAANAVRDFARGDVEAVGQEITGLERSDYRSQYGNLSGSSLANTLVMWPQIISVAVGALLMFVAYRVWRGASQRETGIGTGGFLMLAILLAVGGWLLLGELPQAMASGDPAYYGSLVITTAYAMGTVPVQLFLGIFLAYLMFYEITVGKSLYRVIYFMPYVAPTVATATVFSIMFSSRDYSLANRALDLFGIPAQNWLHESRGVFQIIADLIAGPGTQLPDFLVGPSLALVSVVLYSIWVFAGYNAVIFLAGLGAIPGELYEAAKVDGAGRWAAFRKITFPLLSPTTFFLTILGITGTFRAFTHVYVMRQAAARGTADTASVYIFVQFWQFNQWGYASALAFVLFGIILILTLVQNEASKGRVFYG